MLGHGGGKRRRRQITSRDYDGASCKTDIAIRGLAERQISLKKCGEHVQKVDLAIPKKDGCLSGAGTAERVNFFKNGQTSGLFAVVLQ